MCTCQGAYAGVVSLPNESPPPDWQPATSQPGELLTPAGQIKATGAFMRNLKNRDPRGKRYRCSMQWTALAFVGFAVALVALVAMLQAVL
jgi:hypothetical protein